MKCEMTSGVLKLVANEAIYHRQCHTKFFHKMGASTKSVGRPGDTSMKDISKCLCDWLETESEIELVTLKELHEKNVIFI